jgi:hypothetical protein
LISKEEMAPNKVLTLASDLEAANITKKRKEFGCTSKRKKLILLYWQAK